ncbi:MAG: elongation factor G [Victivallales bacterium]|nr:elongation factor G [Victivallales bacterium]
MKNCAVENIRNFALAGHAGAGKTTLADLLLFKSGIVPRLGSVNDGTSVADFRDEEKDKKSSIFTAALHCPWKDSHFFFTDTPGYPDFCGDAISAISVADTVLIVVDAVLGIGPGTLRAWKLARDNNKPRAFVINGIDREQADYDELLASLQAAYGCTALTSPSEDGGIASVLSGTDADAFEALTEAVAESDEELLEKYFDAGELTEDELLGGLRTGIATGEVVPVFAVSATEDTGVDELFDAVVSLFPSPVAMAPVPLVEGELDRTADLPVGSVFKSVNDPFIGQLTYMRIYSGTITTDTELLNLTKGNKERFGGLMYINGKEQDAAESAGPGEIVAVAKLKNTGLGDVLAGSNENIKFPPPGYPSPTMSYAVYAVGKGDEDKIGTGLHRFTAEDFTFKVRRDDETHETVINGMGDQHVAVMVNRLKSEFRVEVDLQTPKVPYRETITATGQAQYRHKKQTGGHGQFAEVQLRLEPLGDGEFEFANEVVGGNVPKNFIPAIEKGVIETMVAGPLANSKVIGVKAVVFDGKHHPVDSSEMAFKIAARGAFRDAMGKAKPSILEPIMALKITFPDEYMGDITGDLNSRRGRILGMEVEEGMQVLSAEVPLAETYSYSTQLRSITHGRGSFEMEFLRYDPVPSQLAGKIQEAAAQEAEEE